MSQDQMKSERSCCCCCSSDECDLHSMMEARDNNGHPEVYATIISDCFGIEMLAGIEEVYKNLYVICDSCIHRLREAVNFRHQVQDAYNRIHDLIDRDMNECGNILNDVKVELSETSIDQPNILQMEYPKIDSCADEESEELNDTGDLSAENGDGSEYEDADPNNSDNRTSTDKKRKRTVNREQWKKVQKKMKRNHGEAYISTSNKMIPACTAGPPCHCRQKCFERLSDEYREQLHREFWDLGDFNMQNLYLLGLMKTEDVKRRRTKKNDSRRNCTVYYEVPEDKNATIEIKICKSAFLSIFGLHNHRGRVENLQKKIQSTDVPFDKRGKHKNKSNRIREESIAFAKAHIESIPDYMKQQKNENKYFESDFSIHSFYGIYVEKCTKINKITITMQAYKNLFYTLYNAESKRDILDEENVRINYNSEEVQFLQSLIDKNMNECEIEQFKTEANDIDDADINWDSNIKYRKRSLRNEREKLFGTAEQKGELKCQVCNKVFSYMSSLTQHIKTTHPEQMVYDCEKCRKSFTHELSLLKHLRIHGNVKDELCRLCNEVSPEETNVEDYIKVLNENLQNRRIESHI